MKRSHLRVLALLILVAGLPIGGAQASSTPAPTRITTFRLHLSAPADPHTTFWVSYGPLAGKWGLIRLRRAGHGYFAGSRALPAGRSVFCYIAGTGTVQTAQGRAPGSPMLTVGHVGPGTAIRVSARVMTWAPPVG